MSPIYEYKCVRCDKVYDEYLKAPPPQLIASEYPCEKNGMCDLERKWSANYGIGTVYGGGGSPSRQSTDKR